MKLAKSTCYDGFNTSLSASEETSLLTLANSLKCFLINLFLIIGKMSVFNTDDFKLSLSLFSRSYWNNKWSILWSFVPQGHVRVSVILIGASMNLHHHAP